MERDAALEVGQGAGLSSYALGQVQGDEGVTLTIPQMPAHSHSYAPQATTGTGNTGSPAGGLWASPSTATNIYLRGASNTTMSAQTIGPSGGSQPHENRQPLLALNFVIALQGIYPSRN